MQENKDERSTSEEEVAAPAAVEKEAATEGAALSEEEVTAPAEPTEKEAVTEGAALSEEEAVQQEREELEKMDGDEFAAHYHSAKERDIVKLSKELEEQSKNDTKKKKWKTALKYIFLAALIGLSIGLMFGLGDYVKVDGDSETPGFVDMLNKTFSWQYFLVLLAAIVAYILFDSLKYSYLLKISTGKWRLKNAIKVMLLGKYYDGITPLGTGGQPFQIYYLHKRQVPAGVATAIPLVKYIVTAFVFGIICAVFLGLAPNQFEGEASLSETLNLSFMILAWVSLAFYLLIPLIIILFSAFPKASKKIIAWIVKVLHKMRIVKRKYSVTRKYVYEVAEYRNALKLLIRKWYMLLPLILLSVIVTFLYLSLPFFAVMAIGGNIEGVEMSWSLLLQIWSLTAVSFFSATLVPTPGNSGALDGTSFFVFATVSAISTPFNVVGWVVFTWRFASFYLYIIVGICMTLYTTIRDAVRAKRKRKLSL